MEDNNNNIEILPTWDDQLLKEARDGWEELSSWDEELLKEAALSWDELPKWNNTQGA